MKIKVLLLTAAAVILTAGNIVASPSLYRPEVYSTEPQPLIADSTPTPAPIVLPTSPQQVIPPGDTPFNTNGLSFVGVDWKIGTGLATVSSGEAGYLQADGDLWSLKDVDIGFSGNATLGAYNSGISSAAADVALFKNLSNFQLVGKIGVGGNFQNVPGIYGEAGVDINYNLTAGTGWAFLGSSSGNFTYCFAGVKVIVPKFQFAANGSTFEKVVTAGVGYAF